jgi:hypothetical protein
MYILRNYNNTKKKMMIRRRRKETKIKAKKKNKNNNKLTLKPSMVNTMAIARCPSKYHIPTILL